MSLTEEKHRSVREPASPKSFSETITPSGCAVMVLSVVVAAMGVCRGGCKHIIQDGFQHVMKKLHEENTDRKNVFTEKN